MRSELVFFRHSPLAHRVTLVLGAIVLLTLAACGGGSSGCGGGGGGYSANDIGQPGLLDCSSGGGGAPAAAGAGSTADVTNLPQVAQNIGVNTNAYLSVFYPMTRNTVASVPMPAPGASDTLTLTGGTGHPVANPNDYTLTASHSGYYIYCEVASTVDASAGYTFYYGSIYPQYNLMSGTTATLRIYYPTFTSTGSFHINCVGVNAASGSGTAQTTRATMTITVP